MISLLLALFLAACGAVSTQTATRVSTATRPPDSTSEIGTPYTVIGPSPANARVEPVTIGPIKATFEPGETVTVVSTIVGQTVGGSNQWHVIEHEGRRLYIHSNLVRP